MSSLHPKFTVSVYQPGLEFNQDPFDARRGFAIHTMKATDPPQDLSTMYQSKFYTDKLNESSARKMYQANLKQSLNQTASTLSGMTLAKSQLVQTPTSPDSKLKSRLHKDVELANQITTDNEETEAKPVESATSRVPETQDEYQLGKPIDSSRKPSSLVGSPKNRFVKSFNPFSTTPNFKSSTWRSGTSPDYIKMRSKSSALKKTLYYDTRINSIPKTAVKNDVIEALIDSEDLILTNPALLESVIKLRDMKLLKTKVPGVNKYKGVGKVDYVYNDFHSRSTNPGYSRNHGGVFYFR